MAEVAAALIGVGELLWEFVSGKSEPGEAKEQALVRECREEIAEGTPQKLVHNDIHWITPAEIDNYEICPADEEILGRIREKFTQSREAPQ